MEITPYTAADDDALAEVVDLMNEVAAVDSPWEYPETLTTQRGMTAHGWDGEAPRSWLGTEHGRTVAAGQIWASEWDNTHLAWTWVVVRPSERRRGLGSELVDFLVKESRGLGRTSLGVDGWDHPATTAFAARHGLTQRSVGVRRRQTLADVDGDTLARLYDEAQQAAADYELVRLAGRTPPEMLDAVAEMSAAINDAPTDDLDIEDEVFPAERVAGYETATLERGNRLYRVLARHRATGELAGHTVVAVEAERPWIGEQHDTSVVRAHRGHRLGILLKADMVRWLGEAEPELRTIGTWNAETNDHMIEVNEKLGYRVLGRGLEFQRDI